MACSIVKTTKRRSSRYAGNTKLFTLRGTSPGLKTALIASQAAFEGPGKSIPNSHTCRFAASKAPKRCHLESRCTHMSSTTDASSKYMMCHGGLGGYTLR